MASTEPDDGEQEAASEGPDQSNNDGGQKHYEIPSFLDILLQSEFRILHLPPSLQVNETQEDRDYVDWILEQHWTPEVSRAFLNEHEEDEGKEFTYGEVTFTGVRQLMEDMELHTSVMPESTTSQEPVVFYDLGSGEGKLAVQVLLETLATPDAPSARVHIQKVVGIELSPARHAMAEHSWKNLQKFLLANGDEILCGKGEDQQESATLDPKQKQLVLERLQEKLLPSWQDNLHLLQGNFLEFDFSDATHIYASSIFFPPKVLEEMSQKILRYSNAHGKLKVVAALSDLDLLEQADPTTGTCGWEKRVQRLQMSWGGANVRLYSPKDY